MKNSAALTLFALGALLAFSAPAQAEGEYTLTIKNHQFLPPTLEIPAGQKVKINVINQDPTPEEFESYKLSREKIITGSGKAVVFIGPLDPGAYPFFGDFNQSTAKGQIIVK